MTRVADKEPMTVEGLKELQQGLIAADQKVRRGPLRGKLVLKPHFRIQLGGFSFPAWMGNLGPNPLPPGEIVSRYKGSDPSAEMGDVHKDPEQAGHWLITGSVQYVVEWYTAWLALLDGEERLRKGQ